MYHRRTPTVLADYTYRNNRATARETREGWPLGDSKSINERGISLVGSLGSSCRCKRLFALVSPVQNIFFLTVHYINLCGPHRPATWAGSRAGPPVFECVSLGMSITAKLQVGGGGQHPVLGQNLPVFHNCLFPVGCRCLYLKWGAVARC